MSALAVSAVSVLKPVYSPQALLQHHDQVAELVQGALKPDIDYGLIPGTGDKPTLLKPGAEKLCLAFGCRPEYELVESEIDHHAEIVWVKRKKEWFTGQNGREFRWKEESGTSLGLYRYRYRCKIVHGDGRVLATAEGVCSTLESKYIDRPRDTENTVCKMAQKRAYVAATLHAFALSNRFTQDIEDMDRETQVEARKAQQARSAPSRQANGHDPAKANAARAAAANDHPEARAEADAEKITAVRAFDAAIDVAIEAGAQPADIEASVGMTYEQVIDRDTKTIFAIADSLKGWKPKGGSA